MSGVMARVATAALWRRMAALALLATLILAVWSVAVMPVLDGLRERREEIDTAREQRARLQAMAARGPTLAERRRVLAGRIADEGGLWTGMNASAIAAGMQDRLRQAVRAGGGVVKSAAEIRGGTEAGVQRVRVRLLIEGPLASVQQALASVAAARPAIFVDSLGISAPNGAATPDHPPVLSVDLEISAYAPAPPA